MSLLFFNAAPITALTPIWNAVSTAEVSAAVLTSAVGGLRQSLGASLSLLSESERQPLQTALQRLDEEAVRCSDATGRILRNDLQPTLESLVRAWPARFLPDISLNFFNCGVLLGEGGMSRIYRGKDLRTGKDVAIKVAHIPADMEKPPSLEEVNASLRQEYEFLGSLRPGTGPRVLQFGTLDGQVCMVVEFLEGRDLFSQWDEIRHGLRTDGDLDRFIGLSRQLVEQTSALHQQGVVHCDIKPENAKYHNGRIRIFDFGIATRNGQEHPAGVCGTPDYMPPESFRDARVGFGRDVFALGATMYMLLAGQNPFEGDSWIETRNNILNPHFDLMPPSEILLGGERSDLRETLSPAALARLRTLDGIILRALNRDQNIRFKNATEMLAEFRRLLARPITPFASLAALGARRRAS